MRRFRKHGGSGTDAEEVRDCGQEAVGQALLIAAVSIGALSAGQLSRIAAQGCQTLLAALS
jgi:hypothetical protein